MPIHEYSCSKCVFDCFEMGLSPDGFVSNTGFKTGFYMFCFDLNTGMCDINLLLNTQYVLQCI